MSEPAARQRTDLPSVLHLGCGDDYHDGALNVDVNPDSAADELYDITDIPWPWPDGVFERIEAHQLVEHLPDRVAFFAEAARVLATDGELVISVPLGRNAITDDDHETNWGYATPEQFCQEQRRPWDPDVPFVLVERDLPHLQLGGPLGPLSPMLHSLARRWPDWAAYRCYVGVLEARYRRVDE